MARKRRDIEDHLVRAFVPKELAEKAAEIAAVNDETISQVIRRSLRAYVAQGKTSLMPAEG